jgi:hypothetical protein
MSTQKDIIGAMKQQTSGPSRRALIASGVATSTDAIRYDRSTSIRDVESVATTFRFGLASGRTSGTRERAPSGPKVAAREALGTDCRTYGILDFSTFSCVQQKPTL